MGIVVSWHSTQGPHTEENRDCCGVGLRDDAALCVVFDGSSSGMDSGRFARDATLRLVDWFIAESDVTSEKTIDHLRDIHRELSGNFRRDSASFVIVLIDRLRSAHFIHAGDCLAGLSCGSTAISWRLAPHTLANALCHNTVEELAASPLRNRITRSFRTRDFMVPDVTAFPVAADARLVLATDGFWAVLNQNQQIDFLANGIIQDTARQDDCSALVLGFDDNGPDRLHGEEAENLYFVNAID